MPIWIIYAALGGLASNLFNFLSRFYLKDEQDEVSFAWFFEITRAVIFLFLALFDFKIVVTHESAILFVLLGLTEFAGIYMIMKMHAYSHLSISSILSRTRAIWIPAFAFFFIGERLMGQEYLGILVLFLGLSIAVSPKHFFLDKGAIYANLGAVIIALNVIFLKMLTDFASIPVVMFIAAFPSIFLFPLYMKNTKSRIIIALKKDLPIKIFATAVNVISVYLLLFALKHGSASITNAIYQGMLIVSVLMGIFILREKENILRKIVGSIVTILGLLLLT